MTVTASRTSSPQQRDGNAQPDSSQSRTNNEQPLASYATVLATYGATVAALSLVFRASRRRLPNGIGIGDLVLMSVATHKLSRLITKDAVTGPVRAPFTEFVGPLGEGEVNEKVVGTGWRHAVGELITCPFCLSQWLATAFLFGFLFAPRLTRAVASLFAMVFGSDVLQFAYAAMRKVDN